MKLHPRLTARGVLLARRAERFRPAAEPDGGGWVVGFGHRTSAREGAVVTEDDATALLVYDLSRSARRVEALVAAKVSPELFDALNSYAFRIGPEAFARSLPLRRLNAGDVVAPAEVLAARDREEDAPSAVLAAAQALRDRLSQVLDAPEPAPPPRRTPRGVAPPAAPPPARPPEVPEPSHPQGGARGGVDAAPELSEPGAGAGSHEGVEVAVASEPEAPPLLLAEPAPFPPATSDAREAPDPPAPAAALDEARPPPPPPVVRFERGGRARLWDRMRADPRVYMGVGACGLALFVSALVGILLTRPNALGFAVGIAGVVCLAPAAAFFLQRRAPPA